jgi:NUMOD3 motif
VIRQSKESSPRLKKFCECGCGELIPSINKIGRPARFKYGHHTRGKNNPMYGVHRFGKAAPMFGKKLSEEAIRKMSGERHHNWKGNDVRYNALHDYIKSHLPKPELCQDCGLIPPYDCANISGKYLRDLSDWQWLCRRCHMKSDGRMKNLKQYQQKK